MNSFVAKHRWEINGVLQCFDRVILRGHLPMAGTGYFLTWLSSRRIALNLNRLEEGWWNFKDAAPWFAETLKKHAHALAAASGRPYHHLVRAERMEENARNLAQQDGITEGLVCVYGAMETCRTFRVHYGEGRPKLRAGQRVCLVIYFYWMDREFGLMHVKIQTWFPFTLNCWARRINPLLKDWLAGQSYYWVIDQAEFSTDVLFADRATLGGLRRALYEHATSCFGAEQLMTFLGRKYRETFQGEVRTHWRRREPGAAVKHWVKRNAIKMYDKAGRVLRIETVINDPREFFVHRERLKNDGRKEVGWFPMSKGVANLYRYAQVSQRANERYLEALGVVNDLGVGQRELDWRCAPVFFQGRRRRGLQPLSRDDQALFQAVLRGEHVVRGFRNGEVAERLYGPMPKDPAERRRRSGRVSRRISLLRAHGLVAKYPRSMRYRVTHAGQRFMSTAIHVRAKVFAEEFGHAD